MRVGESRVLLAALLDCAPEDIDGYAVIAQTGGCTQLVTVTSAAADSEMLAFIRAAADAIEHRLPPGETMPS